VNKLSSKNSVEAYLIKELLKDSSNVELVKNFLRKLNKDEIIEFFIEYLTKKKIELEEIKIPVSIFKTKELSSFELIVKFLKEDIKLTNSRIARLVMRSQQSVWNTYKNAKKKRPERFYIKASPYDFPVAIVQNKRYSVLEAIVVYFKEKYELRFSEITKLLNRDQRTVWTVYQRAKKKNA